MRLNLLLASAAVVAMSVSSAQAQGQTAPAQAIVTGQEKPLTVMLIYDVTQHMAFFETLERWFLIGLFLSNLTYALFMFFTYLGLFMFPLFGL